MATQQQFIAFLEDIEPSKSTKDVCAAAHTTLRSKLAAHDSYKQVHVGTHLSGSYARNTALRPKTEEGRTLRPDVDIIVVTNYATGDKPLDVITTLRRALRQLGYSELESNRRSVSVTLGSVDMDVVPIIKDPWRKGGWLIADKNEDEWLTTNPFGHTEWATSVNKEANCNFKPLVKMLKWWRRQNLPVGLKRPKGFILETLVAELMDRRECNYEELVAKLFDRIKAEYEWTVFIGGVPEMEDPSVEGNNVFSRVKPEEFKRFYDKVSEHAALIRRAQKEADPEKALALWQRVFGARFPRQGAKVGGGLLRTATMAGAGLSFPSKAVVPPNKPPGFA